MLWSRWGTFQGVGGEGVGAFQGMGGEGVGVFQSMGREGVGAFQGMGEEGVDAFQGVDGEGVVKVGAFQGVGRCASCGRGRGGRVSGVDGESVAGAWVGRGWACFRGWAERAFQRVGGEGVI